MLGAPDVEEAPVSGVTPWVLLLIDNEEKRESVRQVCEDAGFAVELAVDAKDAVDCLKVMIPWLVVIEDRLYRPKPR